MTDFFRFPHTPHLTWLGPGKPRGDKVFDVSEAHAFLSAEVAVEEKVDGSNVGFSLSDQGELRAQNRGQYLDLGAPSGQWKPLKRWLATRRHALLDALAPDLILFGEWCYAVHSVHYTRLPDWFLTFDVYDGTSKVFWSTSRRDELARGLDLAVVPELGRGRFDVNELTKLLGQSALSDSPAEGVYVRQEASDHLVGRAKLVRAEFAQAIGGHWSNRKIEANKLARTSP